MANPEVKDYENPEVENKESEKKEEVKKYKEEADDLKDELPMTDEESKEATDALEKFYKKFEENPEEAWAAVEAYMGEIDKLAKPLINLAKWFGDGLKNAIDKGNFKMEERDREYQSGDAILIKLLEASKKSKINLVEMNKEDGQYFINQEWLRNAINNLENKDRKFFKKALKAIAKTEKQEAKEIKKS